MDEGLIKGGKVCHHTGGGEDDFSYVFFFFFTQPTNQFY